MYKHLTDLEAKLNKNHICKRLAIACGDDDHSLKAIYRAYQSGFINPLIFGDKTRILELCHTHNLEISEELIVHEVDKDEACMKAVKSVKSGEAQVLMKGNIGTSQLLKIVLNKDYGLRKNELLSHIAIFEVSTYHKLLAVTDVAMNIAPKFSEKVSILNNAVQCLNTIGIKHPKVAVLGAVEMVYENMQATMDAAMISKMTQRGQIKNCTVDGPLALDNVVSMSSAGYKGIKSEVAGDCDLLLVPNIETGNVLYKSMVFFAKAQLAGIVLGASAPIVLTSRSDSPEAKYNSIILACLM